VDVWTASDEAKAPSPALACRFMDWMSKREAGDLLPLWIAALKVTSSCIDEALPVLVARLGATPFLTNALLVIEIRKNNYTLCAARYPKHMQFVYVSSSLK